MVIFLKATKQISTCRVSEKKALNKVSEKVLKHTKTVYTTTCPNVLLILNLKLDASSLAVITRKVVNLACCYKLF